MYASVTSRKIGLGFSKSIGLAMEAFIIYVASVPSSIWVKCSSTIMGNNLPVKCSSTIVHTNTHNKDASTNLFTLIIKAFWTQSLSLDLETSNTLQHLKQVKTISLRSPNVCVLEARLSLWALNFANLISSFLYVVIHYCICLVFNWSIVL